MRVSLVAFIIVVSGFFFGLPQLAFAQQSTDQNSESEQQQDSGKRVRRLRDSLAVDPDQEWVPGRESNDRSLEIERKLSLGEQALQAGDLLQPANVSALDYFNAVLQINPDHERARQGVEQIIASLFVQINTALQAGDTAAAKQLLESVKTITPGHSDIALIESQMAKRDRLRNLLQTAREQITGHQLTEPENNNALATLNTALRIEPGNSQALEGLANVQSLLLADVSKAIGADNFEQAYQLLEQAATIPGSGELVDQARAGVSAAQQRYWRFMAEDISTIIEVGQLDLAAADIETLAATDFSRDELAGLRRRLADARILRDYPAQSTFNDKFVSVEGSGPQMIVIGDGQFNMGSPNSERGRKDKEGPQQQIQIGQSFAIAVTEVTVAQFRQFVDATGYQTDVEKGGASTFYDVADGSLKKVSEISWRRDYENKQAKDQLPVVHVSWNDASAYVTWLSEATSAPYRLVSESEFEYSLRAGSDTRYWWGDSAPRAKVENLTGERDSNDGPWEWPVAFRRYGDGHWGPAPVANYESNANGVHDLGGNVMEWQADCYRSTLEGIPADGTPRSDGNCELHVIRGASWASPPDLARSAYRSSAKSARSASIIGFRVARDL